MNDFMTVKEVSVMTKLATSSIYGLVSKKAIPCFKLGARVVFSRDEVARWVERQRQPMHTPTENAM